MTFRLWSIPLALTALAAAAFGAAVLAENIDPLNDNSQFVWSENAGWLNAEPANCGDCGVQVSKTGLTGYMWGENLGWINLSCKNNGTCAGPGGNWGVTNNGSGALSGYAWAENAGWISFSCQNNPASCASTGNYGVTVSGTTGVFTGNAWGENIGWISFSDTSPVAYQVQTADEDGDSVFAGSDNCPSWPNAAQNLPTWTVPADDPDCDGWNTTREAHVGTDPTKHCNDNTGVNNEPDAWPSDFNDDKITNLPDVISFGPTFNKLQNQQGYNQRYDLNVTNQVLLSDVILMGAFFNKLCG